MIKTRRAWPVTVLAIVALCIPLGAAPAAARPTSPATARAHLDEMLTNISTTTCEVETDAALALVVSAVTVNGKAVQPTSVPVDFDDSYSSAAFAALAKVGPGKSAHLRLTAAPFTTRLSGIATITPTGDDQGDGHIWRVPTTATLTASVAYRQPDISLPADMCAPAQLRSTTTFDTDGASPDTVVGADGSQADVHQAIGQIQAAGDPGGVVAATDADGTTVTVREIDADQEGRSYGTTDGAAVDWAGTDPIGSYPDGVARDGAASLDHELSHAAETLKYGYTDRRPCLYRLPTGTVVDSHIPVTEVAATRTENAYRAASGLPPRTGYGKPRVYPLPPAGATCLPLHLTYALSDTTSHDDHDPNCGSNWITDDDCRTDFANKGHFDVTLTEQPGGQWTGTATLAFTKRGYSFSQNGTDSFAHCPASTTAKLGKAGPVTVQVSVRMYALEKKDGGGTAVDEPALLGFDDGNGWKLNDHVDDCGSTSDDSSTDRVMTTNIYRLHPTTLVTRPPSAEYAGFVSITPPADLDANLWESKTSLTAPPNSGSDTVSGTLNEDVIIGTVTE